jgi:hypothetical protein
VVLTIDPAKRLAQSLGLTELDNTPRQVRNVRSGELYAMMLDMKRTFDEVVAAHTEPRRAEEIYVNPFYQAMSSTFSGTQEYMAMEKLSQLRAKDEWDLIVVDTPPSRSALDFLDAPARLGRFLDGRMLRLLVAPARSGGRSVFSLVTASFGLFSKLMDKILGAQLITDLSGFVGALDSMFGGFRDRAEQTFRVLQAPETAFLVVAVPEPDAISGGRLLRRPARRRADAAGRAHSEPGTHSRDRGDRRYGRLPSQRSGPRLQPGRRRRPARARGHGCPGGSGTGDYPPVYSGAPDRTAGHHRGAARRCSRHRRATGDRRSVGRLTSY